MSEIRETGAAPVSKYAAKKSALAKANVEQVSDVDVDVMDNAENSNTITSEVVKNRKEKKNGIPAVASRYPEHYVQIALLIKNNAEIRRFTALGILNYLLQKGEIKGDERYVSFKWNKFAVKCNGLTREYSYNEPFFLNALVASFSSFSASAQRTIDNFCKKEMYVEINKAVDSEEVENIVNLNEAYQSNNKAKNADK